MCVIFSVSWLLHCVLCVLDALRYCLYNKKIRFHYFAPIVGVLCLFHVLLCSARSNGSKFFPLRDCSNFNFHMGNQGVEYTKVYRYLGIHMHENLDFSEITEVLSQAGGRALGAMISKIHGFKDV